MQSFSWELAEALATAHMRALGFHDARTTTRGADKGIDVISARAAAQVKALKTPVGAPDVQKLKGSAHLLESQLFYSLSGYTEQAVVFAETAAVALFVFDERNNVEPANAFAVALVAQVDEDSDLVEASALVQQLTDKTSSIQAFVQYLIDWISETPWGLNAPPEMAAQLVMPIMGVMISAATLPNVENRREVIDWSERTLNDARTAIAQTGDVLGLDFSELDVAEAIEKLELVRNGDLSEIRMPQHLSPLLDRHSSHSEGWSYLSEVLLLIRDVQKFLKLIYEKKREFVETGKSWSEGTDVEVDWDSAMATVGEFNTWANLAVAEEIRDLKEGQAMFDAAFKNVGKVCAFNGYDVDEIYSVSRSKPSSWLNEDNDEDE